MKIFGVIAFVISLLCHIVEAADTDSPIINAHLGSALNPSQVKEDNDIYITCDIEPNTTSVYKVKWFHDGKEVLTDFKAGIIIADKNLVLQNIKQSTSGKYYCQAITEKGALQSDPLPVNVKDKKSSLQNDTTAPTSTEIPTAVEPRISSDSPTTLEPRISSDSPTTVEPKISTDSPTTVKPKNSSNSPTTVKPKSSSDSLTTVKPTSERPSNNKDSKNTKSLSQNNTTASTNTATPTTVKPNNSSNKPTERSGFNKDSKNKKPLSRNNAATSRTTTTTSRTTALKTSVPTSTESPTTVVPENPTSRENRFQVPGFDKDFLSDRKPGEDFSKQFNIGDCNVDYAKSATGDTHFTWKRGNDNVEMDVKPEGSVGQNWNFAGIKIRLIATPAGDREQSWNFGPAEYIFKQLPRGGLASRWIVRGYGFGNPIVEDWDTLNFYKNLISQWCETNYFLLDERDQCVIY